MEDVGLVLEFPDLDSSTAFASALRGREAKTDRDLGDDVDLVLPEDKQNMDVATFLLIVKSAGTVIGTITGFLKLGKALLIKTEKPSVSITYKGRRVELFGDADGKALVELARVLAGE